MAFTHCGKGLFYYKALLNHSVCAHKYLLIGSSTKKLIILEEMTLNKKIRFSLEELTKKNKEELLKDKLQLEKIEKRLDEKHAMTK